MDALALAVGLSGLGALAVAILGYRRDIGEQRRAAPAGQWRYLRGWLIAGSLVVLGWHLVWLTAHRCLAG